MKPFERNCGWGRNFQNHALLNNPLNNNYTNAIAKHTYIIHTYIHTQVCMSINSRLCKRNTNALGLTSFWEHLYKLWMCDVCIWCVLMHTEIEYIHIHVTWFSFRLRHYISKGICLAYTCAYTLLCEESSFYIMPYHQHHQLSPNHHLERIVYECTVTICAKCSLYRIPPTTFFSYTASYKTTMDAMHSFRKGDDKTLKF